MAGRKDGGGGDRLLASDSGASFLNRCRRSELINEVLLLLPAATASSPERTHAAFVAAGLGHPLPPLASHVSVRLLKLNYI